MVYYVPASGFGRLGDKMEIDIWRKCQGCGDVYLDDKEWFCESCKKQETLRGYKTNALNKDVKP